MVHGSPRTVSAMATRTDYTERLHQAMRLAGLNPEESSGVHVLSKALGCTYQAAKKALDGATKMLTADNNVAASYFLKVDSEWLATGQGVPRSERVWPLTAELLAACRAASPTALLRAENAARAALDMPSIEAAKAAAAAADKFIADVSATAPDKAPRKTKRRHFTPKEQAPQVSPQPATKERRDPADTRSGRSPKRDATS